MNMRTKNFVLLIALWFTLSTACAQRVLFMGDSVTDGGWGNSGGKAMPSDRRNLWDMNHIYGHSYMMLCASELESRHPERGYVFMNRAIGGDDIPRLEARWQKDVIDNRPDVLSLLEGTNDVHYYLKSPDSSFDVDGWEHRYRALLDKTCQGNHNIKLVLCTPFVAKVGKIGNRADFPERQRLINEMARRIRLMCKDYGATLVDFNKLFAKLTTAPYQGARDASFWCWDGIHATPAAYRRMADLWLKKVKL